VKKLIGLSSLWRVPFDHLTRFVIHNFRALSRLCRGPAQPIGPRQAGSFELPAIYTNHEGANIVIAPNIVG
jgi:hypothetical protein